MDTLARLSAETRAEARDEFDVVGEGVAMQLRLLPLREAYKCRDAIQELLTKARFAQLDDAITSSWDDSENRL